MTWIFQKTATPNDAVNLAPATGAELMFFLQEAFKQAGHVVQQWSDGTTLFGATGGWAHGGAGANGAANTNAWIRTRTPAGAGGREFTFQRGATNLVWRHKISHSDGFTVGASATDTPSSADQRIVAGGGTDAAPTFFSWLSADASYRAHIGTDNAAPYNAYILTLVLGGVGFTKHWWFVNMTPGSFPSGDVAPYVVDMATGALSKGILPGATANTACFGQGFYRKGLGGESFRPFRAGVYVPNFGGSEMIPGGIGINPYDGDDNVIPMLIARTAIGGDADPGWKGFAPTDMVGWPGSARSNGDVTDIGAARYAYWEDVALRWPAGVLPAL